MKWIALTVGVVIGCAIAWAVLVNEAMREAEELW